MCSVPLGESPPPPPRTCFGRTELIEEIVRFAENLEPIALIGAGGIGKTSIALAVLHHDRVKDKFGDNRRLIRCDQFPASRTHFLARLSQAVGAGIEHPEDLTPLRPFLSSREMILFLDNAESILDPQGTDSGEISSLVEELSCFKNICLGITSRISTVPPHCKRPIVPTLSMESACDIFYAIYNNSERSDAINNLVKQLDFHALSITLLATTASHNMWSYDRLAKEWDTHRVGVLRTDYNKSLAATIELSLASPTFRQLIPPSTSHEPAASPTFNQPTPSPTLQTIPPSARELLGVVAFFPKGINERNLDWLFPTTPNRQNIFDKFCVLSLTHRNNGFITMLSPIRDYLRPLDPKSSPLLCATRDHYLTRVSVHIDPDKPGFGEAEWIKSEDVNVEHLLDVFMSIDADVLDVWDACAHFMLHLYWHKPQQTVLGPKIEGLPDDHPSKAKCLFQLSKLFGSVGNHAEQKRLLTHTLTLEREKGNDSRVAQTLRFLSHVNRLLRLYGEGIERAEEALGICQRLGDPLGQARCLHELAASLLDDQQLNAAQNATLRMIELIPEEGQEYLLCKSHRILGKMYHCSGEKEKAVDHFKTALEIASLSGWQETLFWTHYDLTKLFYDENDLDNANVHIARAKPYAADDAYALGCAMKMQAQIWCRQCRLEDARLEVLHALEVYKKLGAVQGVGECRELLLQIEQEMESQHVLGEADSGGESSGHNTPFTLANSVSS